MAEGEVRIVKPSIDYTKIPEEFAGKWVAVNRNTHALLGASDTPEGALEAVAVSTGHPTLQALVMTRVPEKPGMAESKPERREPPEPWRWGAERPMTDRAVEVVEAKDYDVLARKHKELMEEANSAHELIMRQGDLLRGVVNAIRGEPHDSKRWSHHDAPDLARDLKADRDALRAQLAHALAVWREFWSERQVRTGNERAYWTHRMEAALTGAGEERD